MSKLIKGVNDLATVNPELAKEWHPTKNDTLKPTDVNVYSKIKVWWYLPYDDPVTGKHFDFEWQCSVGNRHSQNLKCPFFKGRGVWSGFNDLATVNPKLASEWHPTKNGNLKPTDVTIYSNKKIWWYLPYDDPITGKHFDFEWEATIANRNKGSGCPFLSGQAVWPGFNALATINPKLAAEWHPTKNGNLKPTDVTANTSKKVWWLLPYDDPITGEHFDFEWEAAVSSRNEGNGCPYLSGAAVWYGFNDLATINPNLALEWHPTKNIPLTPSDVTIGSNKKVWWLLPYDDPITGEHFDFEWKDTISHRISGRGCPFLAGKAIWPGFNDFVSRNPNLAKEWHPTKNGNLKPTNVTTHSKKKVWWYLPYNDHNTGKHFYFEWQATIADRNNNECPFIGGKAVWPGYNDLATINPDLAKEWHPTKNGKLKPTDVTVNSGKKVWWFLPYDDPNTGKHFDFEWQASIISRNKGSSCPYLNGHTVWHGYNDLITTNPELAKEWHPKKNGELTPQNVTANSNKKVWWILPYDDPVTSKHFDFEWEATISSRNKGNGCPYLANQKILIGFNDLSAVNHKLASEWHPTKNGNLKPTDVTANSKQKVWWLLSYESPITGKHSIFEWSSSIASRNKGTGCPFVIVSKTTDLIFNLLKNKNINIFCEKKFDNLRNKNPLPFDFYINDNFIIEVDGQQHFEPVKHFGGKKDFKIRIKHDNMKNQYCADNNIPILRIPYIYDSVKDKEKIESFVLDFIKTGQIPQEIIDFYSQYEFSNYVECVNKMKLQKAA